ncbi:MAG TPA: phosphoglycerate mutase family protein [Gemmatimonadales bacterium]
MTSFGRAGLLFVALLSGAVPRIAWGRGQDGAAVPTDRALAPTTIILVRHAEKSVPLGDHPLSRQGFARARELSRVLGSTKIEAIYATNYQRTQQTVKPVAEMLGLPVINLMTTEHYVTDLLDRLRVDHAGQTVLVASHRQTVPLIIEALGASPVPRINEEQYDHLYIITISPDGRTTMSSLRYGRQTR